MTRRITLAILATVAVALLLAGLGTLALTRVDARRLAQDEVRDQTEAVAELLRLGANQLGQSLPEDQRTPRGRFEAIRTSLDLEDISLVAIGVDDEVLFGVGDPLPLGLAGPDLDPAALRAGAITSGARGDRVWAAGSIVEDPAGPFGAVVLIRTVDPVNTAVVRWFLLASAGTVLVAALVATRLGRRLGHPLEAATAATARIAHGDLSARLPVGRGGAGDELDQLAVAINGMAESLERSRGLERQFLMSVSHDLRTPLTSIRGYAEAIADGAAPDPAAAAGTILAESRRLDRLVRDLLDLAKLDARQFRFHLEAVDATAAGRQAVEASGQVAAAAGQQVVLSAPDAAVPVVADPDRLRQVLANLLDNAVRHARHRVDVLVVDDPVAPRLEVHDDGPGIATEDLPHVFERLYVARATPRAAESGSGLGLAIVRELVEGMGGTVRAASAPAGGARLVVTLRRTGAAPGGPPPTGAPPVSG